jgi:hypothetical protein
MARYNRRPSNSDKHGYKRAAALENQRRKRPLDAPWFSSLIPQDVSRLTVQFLAERFEG